MNAENIPFVAGRQWHYWSVLEVLRNPKYTGWNVWGCTDQKLYGPTKMIARDKWISCQDAFTPIIDLETFQRMQNLLDDHRIYSDDEMPEGLRKILQKHGRISRALIRVTKGIPCETQYYRRYGNLHNAYERIEYRQKQGEFTCSEQRLTTEGLRDQIAERIAAASQGRIVVRRKDMKIRPTLLVDGTIKVDILPCPYRYTIDPVPRWMFYPHRRKETADLSIACPLTRDNKRIARVYLVPGNTWRHMYKLSDFLTVGLRLRKPSDCVQCCYDEKLRSCLPRTA